MFVLRFFCCCCAKHLQLIRREYNPPFTEHYMKVIRGRHSIPVLDPVKARKTLGMREKERGWQVRRDHVSSLNYKCKLWRANGTYHGEKHGRGELMRTYETIGERGLFSYDINQNPAYKVAISAQVAARQSTRDLGKFTDQGKDLESTDAGAGEAAELRKKGQQGLSRYVHDLRPDRASEVV